MWEDPCVIREHGGTPLAAKRSKKKGAAQRRQRAQAQASRGPLGPAEDAIEVEAQAGSEATEPEADGEDTPMHTLVPHQTVRMLDGSHVLIEPWPFEKTQIMLPRLTRIYEVFQKGSTDSVGGFANELIVEAFAETKELVREAMSEPYDDEQFKALTMEDGLSLTTAMVAVCLLRPDGGGLLPKVAQLIDALNELVSK